MVLLLLWDGVYKEVKLVQIDFKSFIKRVPVTAVWIGLDYPREVTLVNGP